MKHSDVCQPACALLKTTNEEKQQNSKLNTHKMQVKKSNKMLLDKELGDNDYYHIQY